MSAVAELANQQMVDRLIAEGALWTPRLIAAFRQTPRHLFVDRVFQYQRKHNRWRELITRDPGPEEAELVYSDRALITRVSPPGPQTGAGVPISSSSQPSLMAQMLEDVRPGPGMRVLEVGAGTGYNACLLAHVAGPGLVFSVDVDREVVAEAWAHLRAFPERQVQLRHADGREGLSEAAPFDRIMVTAATDGLHPAWLEQLAEGGLFLAPLVLAPGLAYLLRGTARAGVLHGRLTRAAYFMPLRAEGEAGDSGGDAVCLPEARQCLPAPWAGWFERKRPRAQWLGFVQALAFYGLLRGLNVHYRTLANGQATFGVSRRGRDADAAEAVCWLGSQEWQTSGPAGRDLGWGLWRAFLDAGGPWPTEFELRASPAGGLAADRPEGYVRWGPRCQQVWELQAERDRPAWA
jgi:protein-L-isoaspartate(D-aspartate) O-methyltransferase